MKQITISNLMKWKQQKQKFATSTAYDASFSQLFEQQEMPVLLVGDSLGMVLQGNLDTLSVTIDEVAYHVRCVRKGSPNCLLIADMPFMTYPTLSDTFNNAKKLMQAGANMVKLEGGRWLKDSVMALTQRSVPVCAHLGLTPQSVNVLGGFKVQGRAQEQADLIFGDAKILEQAGAQLLVLECVPRQLAKRITDELSIPVIGIGAGPDTDAQILVMHDLLGISANYMPKFSKNYLTDGRTIQEAIKAYMDEVEQGEFPDKTRCFE